MHVYICVCACVVGVCVNYCSPKTRLSIYKISIGKPKPFIRYKGEVEKNSTKESSILQQVSAAADKPARRGASRHRVIYADVDG